MQQAAVTVAAAVAPPRIMPSISGPELPSQRMADLPGVVSLSVRELFPDIPPAIYLRGDDLSPVRQAAERALAGVDMSKIKAGDSVNLLCSEHGFNMMEGRPYAEMIRTVKDVIQERTGCRDIRMRFAVGVSKTEAKEIGEHFGLSNYFRGRYESVGPFDRGIAIETEIGTLYGLAKIYDADWIVHCHYEDPREVYLHHVIDRALKSFTMSYARFETRSTYHRNFESRSANIVPLAIFDSPFVRSKFAFTSFLMSSPAGVTGVSADHDLHRLNRRLMVNTFTSYGKMIRLFREVDECVAALDSGRWGWYCHGGGVICGCLFKAPFDGLDLDDGPTPPAAKAPNPAVKTLLINYVWREMLNGITRWYPVVIGSQRVAEGLPKGTVKNAKIANNLEAAWSMAIEQAGTDKVIIFDGNYGSINVSPSMAEILIARAPEVSRQVDQLIPKWLKQRGIDPETV